MTSMIVSTSPQRPDEVVGKAPVSDGAAVAAAVSAARTASREWAATPGIERARRLDAVAAAVEQHLDELAELTIREVGKPRSEAVGEVRRAVDVARFNAQLALLPTGELHPPDGRQRRLISQRRPHGAVGLITPWNFPLAIPMWKAAPALALGNAVVLKPSPESAITTARLMEIVAEQLPDDVVRVVQGEQETGEALVAAADAVSFTGSNAVGAQVIAAAASRPAPVQAEMGGHNAAIVLPDADIAAAARDIAYAIVGFAGQKCTATRRVIVVGAADSLVEALVAAVDAAAVGDPDDASTMAGPLITDGARQRFAAAAAEAGAQGRVLTAARPELSAPGHFVTPTLVEGLPPDARLLREEVFGPMAAILTARDDAEAVKLANAVDYGLTGAVYGSDLDRAQDIASRIHVGMTKVNEPTTGASIHVPFGGEGASSFGPREQGLAAVQMYTWTQTLAVTAY